MTVSWEWVALLAALLMVLYVAGRALVGRRGWRWAVHALLGIGGLFAAQALWTGVSVNLVTLTISGVFGLPGAVMAVVLTAL